MPATGEGQQLQYLRSRGCLSLPVLGRPRPVVAAHVIPFQEVISGTTPRPAAIASMRRPSRRVAVRRALRVPASIKSNPEISRSPRPKLNPAAGTPRAIASASSRMHPAPMVPSSAANITKPPRARTSRGPQLGGQDQIPMVLRTTTVVDEKERWVVVGVGDEPGENRQVVSHPLLTTLGDVSSCFDDLRGMSCLDR